MEVENEYGRMGESDDEVSRSERVALTRTHFQLGEGPLQLSRDSRPARLGPDEPG